MSDVGMVDLAKYYLKKWFGTSGRGISIKVNGDRLRISKSTNKFKNFSISTDDFGDKEPFDIEDKMNSILNAKLEKAVSDIFTDDMIKTALIESNVISLAKEKIGTAIRARVSRDANAIVDEALEDLEDNITITTVIRRNVEKRIKGAFE